MITELREVRIEHSRLLCYAKMGRFLLMVSHLGHQLNKANTSDKETAFLDLNIKVIGSDVHTSVYGKRNDFGFHFVNSPWLSGDVLRLQSYGIYTFRDWLDLLGVILAF